MEQKSIYIAGPMSGYENFNFPAFFAAEEKLKAEGYIVYNPANKEVEQSDAVQNNKDGDRDKLMEDGFDFREVFKWDTEKVIECDAIYMLKGWEKSPGARAEHMVACTMQHYYKDYKIIYE